MPEPGWTTPKFPEEDCWAVLCPVLYCGANPGNPCMNRGGKFARTHIVRREYHERGKTKYAGPGRWSIRPEKDLFVDNPE